MELGVSCLFAPVEQMSCVTIYLVLFPQSKFSLQVNGKLYFQVPDRTKIL